MVQENDFDTYMGIGTNQKNNHIDKKMNCHLFDSTVTFFAFDLKSYDFSHNGINGGYRVVP